MTRRFTTCDGRIVARLIMLAARFGCSYTELTVAHEATQDIWSVEITFTGPERQLQRLSAQLDKLLTYEKEIFLR